MDKTQFNDVINNLTETIKTHLINDCPCDYDLPEVKVCDGKDCFNCIKDSLFEFIRQSKEIDF